MRGGLGRWCRLCCRGRGGFSRFCCLSSLADGRSPSLLFPRTRENSLPSRHSIGVCRTLADRVNLGEGGGSGQGSAVKSGKPGGSFGAEAFRVDAGDGVGTELHTMEGAAQQGCSADGVAGLVMVESNRGLDEGLEERFLRIGEGKPNALPMFVGEEELGAAIAVKARGEGAGLPVEGHGVRIGDFR